MSETPRHFCTLFDSNYLAKGLAMLRSLAMHCPGAQVFVLCMDTPVQRVLEALALPGVTCIELAELETPELLAVKPGRGVAEYCWTLSPCLPWYVLKTRPEVDFITYLDADIFFYSSLEPLFEEIGAKSIAIIEHRFSDRLYDREVNGRFCVEWVSFRRDDQGLACLECWRSQCIEWCFYRVEDGRMGDQKYLDEWPRRYVGCHIIEHLGAGVAPWNYSRWRFGLDALGRNTVDGVPLIFYHFHQFELMENGSFDRLSTFYTRECAEPNAIYEAYETELKKCIADVRAIVPDFKGGLKPVSSVLGRRFIQQLLPDWAKEVARSFLRY